MALNVRTTLPEGPVQGTVLAVHGLASNARLWDAVAADLAASGWRCVAVDARGHGESPAPADGYSTEQAARDLAVVLDTIVDGSRVDGSRSDGSGSGDRAPSPVIAAGQSWGGNVVLTLAADEARSGAGRLAGIALLDGGWIHLGGGFDSFDDCWAVLAPPQIPAGVTLADVTDRIRASNPTWPESGITATIANLTVDASGRVVNRLSREHHRSILESMFNADPHLLYPVVDVPALLMPAGPATSALGRGVDDALTGLRDARLRRYEDSHHDLHAQYPSRVAADLLAFAAEATA